MALAEKGPRKMNQTSRAHLKYCVKIGAAFESNSEVSGGKAPQ